MQMMKAIEGHGQLDSKISGKVVKNKNQTKKCQCDNSTAVPLDCVAFSLKEDMFLY